MTSVDIYGTCVTRDAFAFYGEESFTIKNYVQGINIYSLMTPNEGQFQNIHLEDEDFNEVSSAFMRRMHYYSFNKDFIDIFFNSSSEYLIVDLRAFSYDIIELKTSNGDRALVERNYSKRIAEALKRRGIEVTQSVLVPPIDDIKKKITLFFNIMEKRYPNKIIINQVIESSSHLTSNGICQPYDSIPIEKIKAEMDWFLFIVTNYDYPYIKNPFPSISDDLHKWGPERVHFVSEYYDYVIKSIQSIIDCQNSNKMWKELDILYLSICKTMNDIQNNKIKSIKNTITRLKQQIQSGENLSIVIPTLQYLITQQNSWEAMYLLSTIYQEGKIVEKNELIAVAYLRNAYALSERYYSQLFDLLWKLNKKEYYDEAYSIIVKHAELGKKDAMARLAKCYRLGKGVTKDLDKALFYYDLSAAGDYTWVKDSIFDTLWEINTADSLNKAVSIVRPFAEKGDKGSIVRLAKAYRYGKGVEYNPHISVSLLTSFQDDSDPYILHAYLLSMIAESYEEHILQIENIWTKIIKSGNTQLIDQVYKSIICNNPKRTEMLQIYNNLINSSKVIK
ncbi:MAG: sel1 repeat family protein [Candidatus Methanomethylophilaceae archaeon]|nr:sel1 repeat family protein [Candidatus Methanomethylophilaceae archaeon]